MGQKAKERYHAFCCTSRTFLPIPLRYQQLAFIKKNKCQKQVSED